MFLLDYAGFIEHKKKHEDFIRKITGEAALFSNGIKKNPNHFVDSLKDWALSHIMSHDIMMSEFIKNLQERTKFGMILTKDKEEVQLKAEI